ARAPERVERAGARLSLASDLRRRRAQRDPDPQGGAADLLAAGQGLLLADAREVRDPGLPPARLLLPARAADDVRRPRARDQRGDPALPRPPDHGRHDRARSPSAHLGNAVHALRHVVRHGVEQGPALTSPESEEGAYDAVTAAAPEELRSTLAVDRNRMIEQLPWVRGASSVLDIGGVYGAFAPSCA